MYVLRAPNDVLLFVHVSSPFPNRNNHTKHHSLLKKNLTLFFGAMAKVKKKVKTEGSNVPKTSKKAHLEFA